jgi:hypothetical protein
MALFSLFLMITSFKAHFKVCYGLFSQFHFLLKVKSINFLPTLYGFLYKIQTKPPSNKS